MKFLNYYAYLIVRLVTAPHIYGGMHEKINKKASLSKVEKS